MSKPRDVVVVRVSEKGDREDEHFHSPEVQIEAARRWAKDRGERLVASPIPEIDVSGKLPLSKRLATIALDAPVACAPDALRYQGAEAAAVTALFAELGFQRLSQRIAHWQS